MEILQTPQIVSNILIDDGTYPNNPYCPLIGYIGVLLQPTADEIAEVFYTNKWGGIWYNGVYSFHHYHSTAHEVLAIVRGKGRVQFGGSGGVTLDVDAGDVVIVPAGVAHKKLWSNPGFLVVGGYPEGQQPDMNYGKPQERPEADEKIISVLLPIEDPVFGKQGPLITQWHLT